MDNTLRELNIDYRGFRSDFPKNRECIAEEEWWHGTVLRDGWMKKLSNHYKYNSYRSTLPFKLHRSVVSNEGNMSSLLFTKYVEVDRFAASKSIAVPAST